MTNAEETKTSTAPNLKNIFDHKSVLKLEKHKTIASEVLI